MQRQRTGYDIDSLTITRDSDGKYTVETHTLRKPPGKQAERRYVGISLWWHWRVGKSDLPVGEWGQIKRLIEDESVRPRYNLGPEKIWYLEKDWLAAEQVYGFQKRVRPGAVQDPQPAIDIDTFDAQEYFPAKSSDHDAAIALGLHRLMGWGVMVLKSGKFGYACAQTIDGTRGELLNQHGFFKLNDLGPDEVNWSHGGVKSMEADYLARPEFKTSPVNPRVNLELALPVAERILERYCTPQWWASIPIWGPSPF